MALNWDGRVLLMMPKNWKGNDGIKNWSGLGVKVI